MVKYYLDTSIWRDYYENRSDNLRPLGDWAFELLRKAVKEKSIVYYSELVITELNIAYGDKEIQEIFSIVQNIGLLKKANVKRNVYLEANKLKKRLKIPFADIMHAVLAKNYNAVLVYRDKHFYELQKIVDIMKPEELI